MTQPSGIIIAPFSNSGIRDWPGRHYSALIGLLLDQLTHDTPMRVIGMRNQVLRSREIVRAFPSDRVIDQCGDLSWSEMISTLRSARCLIANNSGIAHLGGYFSVPTVSIFAGTHQRREWRALGASVVLVTRAIGCAPCQRDHGQTSPYDKACLREIAPETVAEAVILAIRRAGTSGSAAHQKVERSDA
jgi:ADP-heptose:LPS heptosyltransferase